MGQVQALKTPGPKASFFVAMSCVAKAFVNWCGWSNACTRIWCPLLYKGSEPGTQQQVHTCRFWAAQRWWQRFVSSTPTSILTTVSFHNLQFLRQCISNVAWLHFYCHNGNVHCAARMPRLSCHPMPDFCAVTMLDFCTATMPLRCQCFGHRDWGHGGG